MEAPPVAPDLEVANPRFTVHNGTVYVAFGVDNDVAHVYRSTSSGWEPATSSISMISGANSEVFAIQPRIASNGDILVGLVERGAGQSWDRVFASRWTSDSWSSLGPVTGQLYVWNQMDLQLHGDQPVVLYQDYFGDGEKAPRVKRRVGDTWQDLGRFEVPGTLQNAFHSSLALLSSGNPVVGFHDTLAEEQNGEWPSEAYVGVHDGSWNLLGGGSMAEDPTRGVFGVEVAVAPDDTIYAAYRVLEGTAFKSVAVRRFVDGVWVSLPSPELDSPHAMELVVGPTGSVVVGSVQRDGDSARIVIKAWDGSVWKTLGAPRSPREGYDIFENLSLTFDGDQLWALWVEAAESHPTNAGLVTVAKLE